jgi:fumarate hydratase class II
MYRAARRVVRINRALTRGGVSDAGGFRTERDTMGELRVPAAALWGASTARAVVNFNVSGVRMPAGVIHSLARIKVLAKRDAHGVRASQRARRPGRCRESERRAGCASQGAVRGHRSRR